MIVEIKKGDNPHEVNKKLKALFAKISDEKKSRLTKLFGVLTLKEDAVTFQRRWRDQF